MRRRARTQPVEASLGGRPARGRTARSPLSTPKTPWPQWFRRTPGTRDLNGSEDSMGSSRTQFAAACYSRTTAPASSPACRKGRGAPAGRGRPPASTPSESSLELAPSAYPMQDHCSELQAPLQERSTSRPHGISPPSNGQESPRGARADELRPRRAQHPTGADQRAVHKELGQAVRVVHGGHKMPGAVLEVDGRPRLRVVPGVALGTSGLWKLC